MNTLMSMTTEEIYLSWVNDFLTVESMAEYYGVQLSVFVPFLESIVKMRGTIYG